MKKILLLLFIILFSPIIVFAHPGNTDSSGCHTCRTNCPSWGLSYGEYHCHNPKPYIPVTPSAPLVPSCPSMSSYDYSSGQCKCFSGYVTDTNYSGDLTCVSGNSKCQKTYGYGAKYDSLSGKCECNFGYIMSGGKCVSESDYCRNSLGFNSKYNSLYEKCECNYGYKLYNSKCISEDDYCDELLGNNTKFNSLNDRCECDFGYTLSGSTCVVEEEDPIYLPEDNAGADSPDLFTDLNENNDDTKSAIVREMPNEEGSSQGTNLMNRPGLIDRFFGFLNKLKFW